MYCFNSGKTLDKTIKCSFIALSQGYNESFQIDMGAGYDQTVYKITSKIFKINASIQDT